MLKRVLLKIMLFILYQFIHAKKNTVYSLKTTYNN